MPVCKRLAIVGASARAAAFSAARAGFDVVAADLFADADLARVVDATQVTNYPNQLGDWLRGIECDAWLYTGALENYPKLVDRMAAFKPLLGNCGEALRTVRDPLVLQQLVTEAGLDFPETLDSPIGLPKFSRWLCKTYRGSSGSGVWRLADKGALERATLERAVFQWFVEGLPASAIFACSGAGSKLLGVTRQLVGGPGEREWHYLGSIGPIVVSKPIQEQLAALGKLLADRCSLRGLVGVDLVIEGDRLCIIEVNPRYSASVEVLERATGVSAIALHAAACDPDHWSIEVDRPPQSPNHATEQVHAKQILYASRETRVSLEFFEWAIERSGLDSHTAWLADIPHAGESIPAGRPVLTVFAAASSIPDCEANLHKRIAEVEARLDGAQQLQ